MTTTPEELGPAAELPNDRELALHEMRSITEQMRNASLYPYSRKAFRRDRIIGWVILTIIISVIGWLTFNQVVSTAELCRNLYETCVQNNAKEQQRANLYRTLANRTDDPEIATILSEEARRTVTRNCASKYLSEGR